MLEKRLCMLCMMHTKHFQVKCCMNIQCFNCAMEEAAEYEGREKDFVYACYKCKNKNLAHRSFLDSIMGDN